jgi:hypothetical protein
VSMKRFYSDHNIQEKRNFKSLNRLFSKVTLFRFIANLLCNPLQLKYAADTVDNQYKNIDPPFLLSNLAFLLVYCLVNGVGRR